MLSGNPIFIVQPPIQSGYGARRSVNPSSDAQQIFKYYYPPTLPHSPQITQTILTPK